jgi:hypothetical protein
MVVSRRVVLGKRLDGSFGLDVALPDYDAFLDDRTDAGKFSFSSDWTDITAIGSIGIVDVPIIVAPDYFITVPINDYGYRPHVEVRLMSGNTIYDDSFVATQIGMACIVQNNSISWLRESATAFRSLYIAYKEAMAIQ